MEKSDTHGGQREGAGRPAGERKQQISIQLPPALVAWIDALPGSRSEVIEAALVQQRGPVTAEAAPDSVAARVLAFLGALQGMDFANGGSTVVNLRTGLLLRADPDFPDGEMMRVFAGGEWVQVYAHKLVTGLLLQHAEMLAAKDGGKAHRHFAQIAAHFTAKTGLAA